MGRGRERLGETLAARLVVVASYPAVLAAGLALYAALTASGLGPAPASYLSVLAGAGLVTLHEARVPHRRAWHPSVREVGADAMFIATVQAALPYALSFSVVLGLRELLEARGASASGLWPTDWPLAAQVVLMLAAADLMRYWLHRAFHRYNLMWRLHAVHHSPHRLYWLNVGRFHPLEKAIQYAVDTLPFALLGVAPEVLAAYFVFYALNGFFQHSNCRVRLGPLNYLVSGPELHRWHHSEIARESNNNYGNNLIVWDVLFGTRFLPKGREVGELGLHNRDYPLGFLQQMRTPFRAGLEK